MANHWRSEWSDVAASFARMGQADGIAIHHSATSPVMETFDPAYLRALEHGEIARGYNALAYHTMFSQDGDSAESRPYGAMGAATGGHNDHTIAFCIPGYFQPPPNDVPSEAVLKAMAAEIRALVGYGFLTPNYIVRPHSWWTAGTRWATACPGTNLARRVADVETWSHDPAGVGREDDGLMRGIIVVVEGGDGKWWYCRGAVRSWITDAHTAAVLGFVGMSVNSTPASVHADFLGQFVDVGELNFGGVPAGDVTAIVGPMTLIGELKPAS